jgi:hypothetical protein
MLARLNILVVRQANPIARIGRARLAGPRSGFQWPPALGRQPPSRVMPPESTSTAFTLTVPQAQPGGRVLSNSYPPNATLLVGSTR